MLLQQMVVGIIVTAAAIYAASALVPRLARLRNAHSRRTSSASRVTSCNSCRR